MNPRIKKSLLFIVMPATLGMISVWSLIFTAGIQSMAPAITDAAISVSGIVLISVILNNILRYYRPGNGKEWMLTVWIILFTALWLFTTTLILGKLFGDHPEYAGFLKKTTWLRFLTCILVISCVSLITWVRQQSQGEAKVRERFVETEKMARDAELNSIRQQLQPHFLFNSLNSIYALIGSEPAKARIMVQQLSDFLRGTLRRDPKQMVEVEEELLHTKLYLEIEKVRFPRLQVHWELEENIDKLLMPVMLLQPAVENAIKFGLYDTTEAVEITIRAAIQNNQLMIEIENPFDPATIGAMKGTGFGLDSIRRRLYLLYQRNDLVETKTENTRFTVRITIPQTA